MLEYVICILFVQELIVKRLPKVVVGHIFNPSTQDSKANRSQVNASLVYKVSSTISQDYTDRLCVKNKQKDGKKGGRKKEE